MTNVTHEYVANILTQTGDEELKKFANFILETKSKNIPICNSQYYFVEAQQQLTQEAYKRGLEALANDEDFSVRWACVRYGSDEIRKTLVRDKNPDVRQACAIYGSDETRKTLVTDEDLDVRLTCVIWGSDDIKQLFNAYQKGLAASSLSR